MLSYRDLINGLKDLDIQPSWPLLVHASLSAFGEVRGGAETVLGALLATSDSLMMPAFTYRTMVIPETGPPENGIVYGSGEKTNRMAEFFWPTMPADPMVGALAEQLRLHPHSKRSNHPILSFSGINVEKALESQTLDHPLAPVGVLAQQGGWVVLLGVDHTANTAIHLAERAAGRRQFTRWALTPTGIVECTGFPGCSDGFNQVARLVEPLFVRKAKIGAAVIQAMPLLPLIEAVTDLLEMQPGALLCDGVDCERCDSVRTAGQ
ncbi:MAG: AAC(3) family N-acetyltransferase [Anaerolineaceae bacterium]|nr:AAC(3) family N-acetyltransferase [Anaerolineaceae bacterium]